MCLKCVIPLLVHEAKYNVLLFIRKSGLFQTEEYLLRDIIVLVIWSKSHRVVRVVAMVGFLKHGYTAQGKGKSLILISLYNVPSKSIQSSSD